MQTNVVPFPVSQVALHRIERQSIRSAVDSGVDLMTDLMRLPDDSQYAYLKHEGKAFVSKLDAVERSFRSGQAA